MKSHEWVGRSIAGGPAGLGGMRLDPGGGDVEHASRKFVIAHALWVDPKFQGHDGGRPRLLVWAERAGRTRRKGAARVAISAQGEWYGFSALMRAAFPSEGAGQGAIGAAPVLPRLVAPDEVLRILSLPAYQVRRADLDAREPFLVPVSPAEESSRGRRRASKVELWPCFVEGVSFYAPADVRNAAVALARLVDEFFSDGEPGNHGSRVPGNAVGKGKTVGAAGEGRFPHPRCEVLLAPDLIVLARACRLALELLAKELFVPDCDPDAGDVIGRALWRALRHERVVRSVHALAAGLPASAVADGPELREWLLKIDRRAGESNGEPDAFPVAAMWRFVDWVVDAAARTALAKGGTDSRPARIDIDPRSYFVPANTRLVDRWAAALHLEDGGFHLPTTSRKRVREAFDSWRRAEGALSTRAVRLVLFLKPEEGEGTADAGDSEPYIPERWRVEYGLQVEGDELHGAGLQTIFAHEIWAAENEATEKASGNVSGNAAGRATTETAAALRGGLVRVGVVFAPLAGSLSEEFPTGCSLTAEEFAAFLEIAPNLEDLGVVIRLPAWMAAPPAPLRARVRAQSFDGPVRLTIDTLLSYDWRIAVGDAELRPERFERLVGQSLVALRLNGAWVRLDGDQLARLVEIWQGRGPAPRATLDELVARQEESERVAGVPVGIEGAGNDSALDRLLALAAGGEPGRALRRKARREISPPEGLKATLRPYQMAGFAWLAEMRRLGFGACLADDMGLGKTLQVIALLLRDAEERRPEEPRRPSLVVCPTSVLENWRREIARFAPSLETYLHHGPGRANLDAFVETALGVDVVITSYALAPREFAALARVAWRTLVLDEAQFIKNPEAKKTQSVKRLNAEFRVALTGTPVENRLTELWSIMDFANPGYLGSESKFRVSFARPIERNRDEARLARLKRLVKPFILRRVKSAPEVAADLPDKIETKRYCALTAEQAALYQATVNEMMARIEREDGMRRRGLIFKALTRLKQICNHPALVVKDVAPDQLESRSGKLARLVELAQDVADAGERGLIFTQFVAMGKLLQRCLESRLGRAVPFLHGGLSVRERESMVRSFQEGDGSPFLVLSLRAGGVGLNLTSAAHVFHYDRWWNPAVEAQATDRAYRIGQVRNVHVHTLICAGTLEDHIDAMIESKKELAEKVIEAGETWLTELSAAELKEIFALRP